MQMMTASSCLSASGKVHLLPIIRPMSICKHPGTVVRRLSRQHKLCGATRELQVASIYISGLAPAKVKEPTFAPGPLLHGNIDCAAIAAVGEVLRRPHTSCMRHVIDGTRCGHVAKICMHGLCAIMHGTRHDFSTCWLFSRWDQGDEACGLRRPCAEGNQRAHPLCHPNHIKVSDPPQGDTAPQYGALLCIDWPSAC